MRKNKTECFFFFLTAVYWEVSLQLHAEWDLWLLCCLSYLVWLMALPYRSHSHRSISLVQYSLDHDHLAWAQKAKVDVQTSWPSWTGYGFGLKTGQALTACVRNIQCKALFWNRHENARRCGRQGQRRAVPSKEKHATNIKNNPRYTDKLFIVLSNRKSCLLVILYL